MHGCVNFTLFWGVLLLKCLSNYLREVRLMIDDHIRLFIVFVGQGNPYCYSYVMEGLSHMSMMQQ